MASGRLEERLNNYTHPATLLLPSARLHSASDPFDRNARSGRAHWELSLFGIIWHFKDFKVREPIHRRIRLRRVECVEHALLNTPLFANPNTQLDGTILEFEFFEMASARCVYQV